MIGDLIKRNRSYRRYLEPERLRDDQLMSWIELARLSPSSRNQQALKFKVITDEATCNELFPLLAWAGYLTDWPGPEEGERPAGYILILGDTHLGQGFDIDLGIAAQSILLGAVEDGYGGCMIGSIRKEEVRNLCSIEEYLQILLVIALGKPVEEVIIDEVKVGDIRYWRDEKNIHHVPKRKLDDIVL